MILIETTINQMRKQIIEAQRQGVEDNDQKFWVAVNSSEEQINVQVPNTAKALHDFLNNNEHVDNNNIQNS